MEEEEEERCCTAAAGEEEVAADIEDEVDEDAAANNSDLSAADFCAGITSQIEYEHTPSRTETLACMRLYSELYWSESFLKRSTLAIAFSLICGTISLLAM